MVCRPEPELLLLWCRALFSLRVSPTEIARQGGLGVWTKNPLKGNLSGLGSVDFAQTTIEARMGFTPFLPTLASVGRRG